MASSGSRQYAYGPVIVSQEVANTLTDKSWFLHMFFVLVANTQAFAGFIAGRTVGKALFSSCADRRLINLGKLMAWGFALISVTQLWLGITVGPGERVSGQSAGTPKITTQKLPVFSVLLYKLREAECTPSGIRQTEYLGQWGSGVCVHDLACHSPMTIDLPSLQSRDGKRQVFAGPCSQSIKREARLDVLGKLHEG